ncbi:MAG: lipoprotein [Desulfobacteraceae bacterium]|jgi:predicted small lipoprotein YifL|nr:lipoprotein [Desulfobacteraceae bacterium]
MKISKVQIGLPAMTARAVLIVLATVIMVWGCGRKGPPVPPTGSRTPSVKDLVYSISQNNLELSWTVPQPDQTAQLPITGFLIYRSQQSVLEDACPNCPILYKNVGDVPARGPGSGQSGGAPIIFTQTIEPGYRYIYKVYGYSVDGIRSKASNFVRFTF